jgi:hypothetical protein
MRHSWLCDLKNTYSMLWIFDQGESDTLPCSLPSKWPCRIPSPSDGWSMSTPSHHQRLMYLHLAGISDDFGRAKCTHRWWAPNHHWWRIHRHPHGTDMINVTSFLPIVRSRVGWQSSEIYSWFLHGKQCLALQPITHNQYSWSTLKSWAPSPLQHHHFKRHLQPKYNYCSEDLHPTSRLLLTMLTSKGHTCNSLRLHH